jgi:hypothetical protein
MNALRAEELLLVRDLGERQSAEERAVMMLALGFPETPADVLRRLSLGQRNTQLLRMRQRLFGPKLDAFAQCPHCGEALELALNANALQLADLAEEPPAGFELASDGYALRFRLLNSSDLTAAAAAASVDEARAILVARCLLDARRDDRTIAAAELPASVIECLSERLSACDPQAETLIDLVCPACERGWQILFDVASFLYSEIDAQARRLLREVHTLARAYAWREPDILAMSARRRQDYLELLAQ